MGEHRTCRSSALLLMLPSPACQASDFEDSEEDHRGWTPPDQHNAGSHGLQDDAIGGLMVRAHINASCVPEFLSSNLYPGHWVVQLWQYFLPLPRLSVPFRQPLGAATCMLTAWVLSAYCTFWEGWTWSCLHNIVHGTLMCNAQPRSADCTINKMNLKGYI